MTRKLMITKMMNSRRIVFFQQLAIFLLAGWVGGVAYGQQNRPNIVLFIADDVGGTDIGCYGNSTVQTPNIDRIAREGLRFTNAYVTTSSCSPSRCSILSSRYPHNTGAAELHTPLPPDVPTFATLLKNAGYYTAQAGKWHMGEPAKRGFDLVQAEGKLNGDGGEDRWVSTLVDRPKDKPFFLWLASIDAHRDWGPNELSGTHSPADVAVPPYLVDTATTRSDLAAYYDEISRFDKSIGEVEAELERQGVLDNTLIIILSDNGSPFPRSKTRLYDSGVKSPFIVKWPDRIKLNGAVSHSLLSTIDIAPTVLQLAGVDIPDGFQGLSFAPLFDHPEHQFRDYVFTEHNWHDYEAMERMVRTQDFLYILNSRPQLANQGPADAVRSPAFEDLKRMRDEGRLTAAQADVFVVPRPQEELFAYCDDAEQLTNIASLPKYADELERHRAILERWQRETADTAPMDITPDWFDRETGERLEGKQQVRGSMPGSPKQ